MLQLACGNTEKHKSHNHTAPTTLECDGKTECGQWSHPTHVVEATETFYCLGVCDCKFIIGVHGPGAHK